MLACRFCSIITRFMPLVKAPPTYDSHYECILFSGMCSWTSKTEVCATTAAGAHKTNGTNG